MLSPLKTFPLVGLLLLFAIPSDAFQQCYKCTWSEVNSQGIAGSILSFFAKLKNDDCLLKKDSDAYNVDIVTCPEPEFSTQIAKCATVKGKIEGQYDIKITDITVTYDTLTRDCIVVKKDDEDYSEGCHKNPPLSGPMKLLVEESHKGTELAEVKMDGEACYSTDNQFPEQTANTVHCYKCSWGELMTDNSAVNFLLSAFNSLSDESCRLRNHDDIYDITARICEPPANSNQVAKCATVEGTVTGKLTAIGVEVKYKTLVRDCVIVDKDDENYSDGVHENPPVSGVAESLMTKITGSTGLGEMEFKGTATYGTRDNANVPEAYTGGSSKMIFFPLHIFFGLCIFFVLRF